MKLFLKKQLVKTKISNFKIILISVIFGCYSVYVSAKPYFADRAYYAIAYGNRVYDYQMPKLFLSLTKFLFNIDSNPDFLFFSVSFLIIFIIFIAYKKFENANYYGFLLLAFSLFFIFDFHMLKQGLAVAFGTLFLIYLLKKKYIIAVIWLLVSINFHESALILIPIGILLIGSANRIIRFLGYSLFFFIPFCFSGFSNSMSSIMMEIFPSFGSEFKTYFSNLSFSASNIAASIKGLPFYIITFFGLTQRKKYVNLVPNYDKYMYLSIFVSLSYIISSYMYWMFRFSFFGYFLVCMFFGSVIKFIENKKQKFLYVTMVYGSTFIITSDVFFAWWLLKNNNIQIRRKKCVVRMLYLI